MAFLAVALIAILSAACSDSSRHSPTAPTAVLTAVAPPAPPAFLPAPPFPAISKPARVYLAATEPSYASYHGGTLKVRYVLYDDRSFALQYASPRFGNFEYKGTYTEANGELVFHWEGWSAAGPWGATATITEELLTVSYNFIMQMTDFEDGVFVRVRD